MKSLLSTFALALLVTLASCSSDETRKRTPAGETVTINHSLDSVQVPLNPQRVVALDYGALENLDLIDAPVVGIPQTALPDYLSEYGTDASIENLGSVVEVNMERVNELQPDLIILGGRLQDSYEEMSEIAPTIMTANILDGQMKALRQNLDDLSMIFEEEAAYDSAYARLEEKAAAIREKASQSGKNALVVLHNRGRYSAYGSGSRFGLVHDLLGIEEAKEGLDAEIHGVRVSSEFIQEVNPDILFVVDRSAAIGDQPLNQGELENQLIQQTNAYKNGDIYYLNPQAWYLSGGTGLKSMDIMLDDVAQAFN